MKPAYDEIVKWMHEYFDEYNRSAQDAATVHAMDKYFAPDLLFIPYMHVFGGPQNAIRTREDFYSMLTGHPQDYERFVVHDIFVDVERMVSVAFLQATVYETGTDKVKIQKDYLPLYELGLDASGEITIKTIRFFWEGSQPEIEAAAYTVDKSKWGK
jgi:hypothetical protein